MSTSEGKRGSSFEYDELKNPVSSRFRGSSNGHSSKQEPRNTEVESHEVFDFIVIGSGFGGSVSAMRLAEKGYSVLVLERGKRYNAEDFPQTNINVFKHIWLPKLRCFGILGLNFLSDIMILNGSGVGGGSLVYCATLIEPGEEFFECEGWQDLADWETELRPHYDTAKVMLGVQTNPRLWPADDVLLEIATEMGRKGTFSPTPLGIYFGEEGKNVADPYFNGEGPERAGCTHCGGCMVGCRHNAKNSLDKNYLYFAEKYGTQIQPEANVTNIRPLYGERSDGARYEIAYERTTAWLRRPKQRVRARNVVVAAGVLGTNELLLKCRDESRSLPRLSPLLGRSVRTNSEALMGITARDGDVDYTRGASITSHFWVDEVTSVEPVRYSPGSSLMRHLGVPLVDLEGSVPQRIGRFVAYALRNPSDFFKARILPDWARDSTIILVMQTVENRMQLKLGRSWWTLFRKGLVSQRDRKLPIPAVIEAGRAVVESFAQKINGVPQATIHEVLLDKPSTAHVLGGCGMGEDATAGMVDVNHQVFNYPGLYVVDGSVMPGNLGVNPSLTITAMAERAMSRIPTASGTSQFAPLEAPEGYSFNGNGQTQGRSLGRKVVLPLLAVSLGILAARFLFRKQ